MKRRIDVIGHSGSAHSGINLYPSAEALVSSSKHLSGSVFSPFPYFRLNIDETDLNFETSISGSKEKRSLFRSNTLGKNVKFGIGFQTSSFVQKSFEVRTATGSEPASIVLRTNEDGVVQIGEETGRIIFARESASFNPELAEFIVSGSTAEIFSRVTGINGGTPFGSLVFQTNTNTGTTNQEVMEIGPGKGSTQASAPGVGISGSLKIIDSIPIFELQESDGGTKPIEIRVKSTDNDQGIIKTREAGNITVSIGDDSTGGYHLVSGSGMLFASLSLDDDVKYKTVMYDTISGKLFFTGSYGGGGGDGGNGDGVEDSDWHIGNYQNYGFSGVNPIGGSSPPGAISQLNDGFLSSSQQVIVRHNLFAAQSESVCGSWGFDNLPKRSDVGFMGDAYLDDAINDTYGRPGLAIKNTNTYVTAVHHQGNAIIYPTCLTGKPGSSGGGGVGFGLNDGFPHNNLRVHQGFRYIPNAPDDGDDGGGGGGGGGGGNPGGGHGGPGTPTDDEPGGILHIDGGIRAVRGNHDLTQGSQSFAIPTGSGQAPPAVEIRPQAGILFFETGSTLNSTGSFRYDSASAIISFETSSKSLQVAVGSKQGGDITRVLFISHSGINPRIGIGINNPTRAFDFKEVRDDDRGGELLIRGSRTTKGAEINDEVGRINFAIDSASFEKIDTSGSAAEIVSIVDSIDQRGVQGSLSLRVAAAKTSSPIQRIKIIGNPNSPAIEFTGSVAFDSDIDIGGVISGDISASNNISASGTIIAEDYLLPTAGGSLKTQNNGENIAISPDNIDLGFGSSWQLELRRDEGVVLYDLGNVGLYKDFRVEGESDTHLFFITGGDSRIGIGTSTPSEKLTVQGNISASGAIIANTFTGSLQGNATGLTGTPDITVGTIEATSLNITSITSSIVTSSIIQTEGSNIFGDTISDTQTFNGHITASGNISASGQIIAEAGPSINVTLASDSATNIDTFNTSSNNGAIYDYTLFSAPSGARAGQCMVIHHNGNTDFTDTSTPTLGSETSIPFFETAINGANVEVKIASGSGYTFKSFVKKL